MKINTIPDLKTERYSWRMEINNIHSKYIITGTIVAMILNPIFGLVDFFNMHELWTGFMILRMAVSATLGFALLYKPFIKTNPQRAGFFLLSMIITQDAFFFSLATPEIINQLALSYVADFVGASMILMWSPVYALAFLFYFIAINFFFYSYNSAMPLSEFLSDGGLLVLAGSIFAMAMIVFRYHSVKGMIVSKLELLKSNEWMAVQNEIIEQKSAELQKSNNRLKEFAYIVSHDLKSPLRGIRNIATWIREDCSESIDEIGVDHLKLLDKQVLKMQNLINAILEYSKTTALKSKSEWINLDDMIKDVIEMVEIDSRTKFHVKAHIPQIKGTRVVISQVLQNLLSNSIKHNDKDTREVEIEVTENDECFQFMVSDNGPGIEERNQDKIFNLFQTLRDETNFENTGIGLPVAKKMVEEAGGSMWLESTPGNGAKFYFSIPVSHD